jgi:hypothetical protein
MWPPRFADGPKSLDELKRQLALVRALIDELDRVAPRHGEARAGGAVHEQLLEDLARLGHRIIDYASEVSGPSLAKVAAVTTPAHVGCEPPLSSA